MSMMGFQSLDGGVGGWGEVYPSFIFHFWNFLTLKSPLIKTYKKIIHICFPVLFRLLSVRN